jgi:enamine deaminase RidA (YjgF/YER057c/UK114 family)
MSPEENLKKLGIMLPKAPQPVGVYAAYKKINKLVFISGQISLRSNVRTRSRSRTSVCYQYFISSKVSV